VPVVDATLRDAPARIDLERAINLLPAGYKAALLLHDVEDYQHHLIAEKLGWAGGMTIGLWQLPKIVRYEYRNAIYQKTQNENSGQRSLLGSASNEWTVCHF
jgi:hypothetical protein